MKISFIPPLQLMYNSVCKRSESEIHIPLGVLSLASVLLHKGFEVKIEELNIMLRRGAMKFDDNFANKAAEYLLSKNCDLIGFSTMADSYPIMLMIAKICKEKKPSIPIMFGGPQASMTDIATMENFSYIDFIVRGEAEQVIVELCNKLQNNKGVEELGGITYRKSNATCKRNPDNPLIENLDDIPIPVYDLYPIEECRHYGYIKSFPIEVGRGCPFSCSYCASSVYWRRKYRVRSIVRIIEEIKLIKKEYGFRKFDFVHDIFGIDTAWTAALCDALLKENLSIEWSCSCRMDIMDPSLIKTMSEAGCTSIYCGLESGSRHIQKYIGRNLKLAEISESIEYMKEIGIKPNPSFIIGFPDESVNDLEETTQMYFKYSCITETRLHLLTPYVNTSLYNRNKILFDGFSRDAISIPFIQSYQELIRKHPAIFSNFYYFRTKSINRKMLKEFYVLSAFNPFPGTLLAIKNWLNILLVDWHRILRSLVDRVVDCNSTKEKFVDWKKYAVALEKFILSLTPSVNCTEFLYEVFLYEKFLYDFNKAKLPIQKIPKFPNRPLKSMPTLDKKKSVLYGFKYSPSEIINQSMKQIREPYPVKKKNYKLFFKNRNGALSLVISNKFYEFLSLCNGRNNIESIFHKLYVSPQDIQDYLGGLHNLYENNLIEFS